MQRSTASSTPHLVPRVAGGAAAVLAVLAFAACGSTTSGSSGSSNSGGGSTSVDVTAMDYSFNPTQLSVPAGASVTVNFKNDGKVEHSFTLDNGGGEVESEGGGSKTLTFSAPQSGTVSFHCKYHPTQMKGTITVGGSGGAGAGGSSGSSTTSSNGYGY